MQSASPKIRITVGDVELLAELDETPTARGLRQALPIETNGAYWGGELYFEIPVKEAPDETARQVVEPGTVAYWPPGRALCLFWGPTPVSKENECRAASEVNIVGRVVNPQDLKRIKASQVRLEATD